MRLVLAALCFVAVSASCLAQSPTKPERAVPKAQLAPSQVVQEVIKDLPVRKVVLYKNGVGYFEHAGSVTGNQRVTVDFTSAQLNDVLQSLTVLDEGGGRIGGVNYNSTTPLAEQLKSLSLGMGDDPSSTELFQALRGQRVEVTGGPGGPMIGRLMAIESRAEKAGSGDATVEKFYLTLVAGSSAVRVIELNPSLSVRPMDGNLQGQLDRYLELLATTHATGLRHLTLNAIGQGQRDLRVSYISEVPVWKSTYRIVFPHAATGGEGGNAIVQGWAVVDNTVGADWDNVQLALVAGAPQSFIQPLSQPLYSRRLEIPIATGVQTTPQTHEGGETTGAGTIAGTVTDASGAVIPNASVSLSGPGLNAAISTTTSANGEFAIASLPPGLYTLAVTAMGFQKYIQRNVSVSGMANANVNVSLNLGSSAETVEVESENRNPAVMAGPPPAAAPSMAAGFAHGAGGNTGGGMFRLKGVYRATDAVQAGDVSTNAFDDFFEYALTQPVTIHKNESAMVPILQESLPAEHVTLWSEKERSSLRAVWLENKSKLTLDSGSFSIFESGEFAGEGLIDPIHPGEKRLLSYATDQAVRVRPSGYAATQTLHHIAMHNGILVQTTSELTETTYNVFNSADEARTVIIEHPRKPGAELNPDGKPVETSGSAYRFRLVVEPHQSATIKVGEKANQASQININPDQFETEFLINVSKYTPDLEAKLRPLIEAEGALSALNRKITESQQNEAALAADEARARDNVTALKGNEAARRFIEELTRSEDEIQAARKDRAALEQQRDAARTKLESLIAQVSFETDLSVVMQSTR